MSEDVPPNAQCCYNNCEREAVNPTHPAGLCPSHHPEIEDDSHTDEEESLPGGAEEGASSGSNSTPALDERQSIDSDSGERLSAEAANAFEDAVEFFHAQLEREVDFPQDDIDTPREYFRDVRGWDDATIDTHQLGWAPANRSALLDHLMSRGYDREAILGTGLFWENGLVPIWQGRLVFPYLVDGRPTFAISRRIGDEGHKNDDAGAYGDDDVPAKYHKVPGQDCAAVDEPIYGIDSLEDSEDVLITEGVADAITAHAAGYACLSPVTTSFKHDDRDRLLEILDERDVGRVVVVQDAELPTSDVTEDAEGWDALNVEQHGEGVKGAARTAGHLAENGVDARIGELPQPGAEKVDLDDYLGGWADTLDPIIASAVPAEQHPAYDIREEALERARQQAEAAEKRGESGDSALFDLDLVDVASVREDYRGPNPLGHHGDSENYYVVLDGGEVGFDHKHKAAYNALTHLLVEAGERRASSPGGSLSDAELLTAWVEAKEQGHLATDDPVPHAALRHFAVDHGLCSSDDLGDGWRLPRDAYNDALGLLEDKFAVDPGRPPLSDESSGRRFPIVDCEPPIDERHTFDVERHRERLQERTRDWFDQGGLRIFGDDAGTGKTTNAGIAAGEDDEPHAILFEMHEKAREYVTDAPTPDDYFHLKGAEQKREAACMDADHADEVCPIHGHENDCPSMCPVYDLPRDDEFRELFDRLVEEVGPVEAHLLLNPHDDGECTFLDQFDTARHADRLVGVQQYLQLSTVTDDRKVIVDEKPSSLRSQRDLSVRQLTRAGNALAAREGKTAVARTLRNFGAFTTRVVDVLIGDSNAPDSLEELDPPTVAWDAYQSYDDAAGNYMEYVEPEEDWHLAEALAKAKVAYNEAILRQVRDDGEEWDGTPLCFDALLAAAAEAGLDREQVGRAIAAPVTLRDCPRCSTPVEYHEGRGICPECDWDEATDTITTPKTEPARAQVYLDLSDDASPALVYDHLPLAGELPDNALVLDATPTPKRVDTLFNEAGSAGDVVLEGEAALEANVNLTQILDGQYHYRTIAESDRLQDRIQNLIDTAGGLYDRPLFVLKRGLMDIFEFPENAEILHYHAVRGLNRGDCDAVFCLGAPHADVDDLKREAELLAMHRDDVRVGGEEYSTRRDSEGNLAANPPVYRKLNFEDDAGRGRAVPTKAFSGLVGDLFRETREKEIVQAVHRTRPLLADEEIDTYLVTNVPTSLPVDEVASLDELAEPLRSFLPMPEGAVRLLEYVHDVEAGEAPDGFRAETLVKRTDAGDVEFNRRGFHRLARFYGEDITYRTVCNWVDALEDLGLVEPGDYEPREGVPFSVDPATLKSALSVVSTNASFKVAAVRRFAALAQKADGSLRWLRWARDTLGLTGEAEGVDPPPTPGG